jgi:hypothetical protein
MTYGLRPKYSRIDSADGVGVDEAGVTKVDKPDRAGEGGFVPKET